MYEENIFHLYLSLICNVVLGATSMLIQEHALHGQNKLSLLVK